MKKICFVIVSALLAFPHLSFGFGSLPTAIPNGTNNQVLTARENDTPHWSSTGDFTSLNVSQSFTLNGNAGTAGQVLQSTGAGNAPTWATPSGGGGIFKVLSTTTATTSTLSPSTPLPAPYTTLTNLTVQITPSNISSKIWLIATIPIHTLTNGQGCSVRIVNGGTIVVENNAAVYNGSGSTSNQMVSTSALDSPNTTSQITYEVQGRVFAGTGDCVYSITDGINNATLTAMEVGP